MVKANSPIEAGCVLRAVKLCFPLCFAALLSGCAGNLARLSALSPEANDFNSALASEYQSYAASESEQGRLFAADYFAGKGLRALEGGQTSPDPVNIRLPQEDRHELELARTRLEMLLTEDAKRVAPQQLARAQLLFDCWQNERSWGPKREEAQCHGEFESTLAELEDTVDPLIYGQQSRHSVVFEYKTARLPSEAQALIDTLAARLAGRDDYTIDLQAYIGRKASQRRLTTNRLQAVRQALARAGLNADAIRIRKEGSAKAVILSSEPIALNTKIVTITVKTHSKAKDGK